MIFVIRNLSLSSVPTFYCSPSPVSFSFWPQTCTRKLDGPSVIIVESPIFNNAAFHRLGTCILTSLAVLRAQETLHSIVYSRHLSRLVLLNVSLPDFVSFLQVYPRTIHAEEIFSIILDSNFDEKMFSAKIASRNDCVDISNTVGFSTRRKNLVKRLDTASLSFCILVQQKKSLSEFLCTFHYLL